MTNGETRLDGRRIAVYGTALGSSMLYFMFRLDTKYMGGAGLA
jgi:hypothetical protein